MKKLLFLILLTFLFSCEKDISEEPIQRTCWSCDYRYMVAIPQQTRTFCDGTDIKLPAGDITEAQIRQFEREHFVQGILVVECKAFKEK